jgi:hypothetical protein
MIPRVKTWRVNFWQGSKCRLTVDVLAPTKLLAKLQLWDEVYRQKGRKGAIIAIGCDKVTYRAMRLV